MTCEWCVADDYIYYCMIKNRHGCTCEITWNEFNRMKKMNSIANLGSSEHEYEQCFDGSSAVVHSDEYLNIIEKLNIKNKMLGINIMIGSTGTITVFDARGIQQVKVPSIAVGIDSRSFYIDESIKSIEIDRYMQKIDGRTALRILRSAEELHIKSYGVWKALKDKSVTILGRRIHVKRVYLYKSMDGQTLRCMFSTVDLINQGRFENIEIIFADTSPEEVRIKMYNDWKDVIDYSIDNCTYILRTASVFEAGFISMADSEKIMKATAERLKKDIHADINIQKETNMYSKVVEAVPVASSLSEGFEVSISALSDESFLDSDRQSAYRISEYGCAKSALGSINCTELAKIREYREAKAKSAVKVIEAVGCIYIPVWYDCCSYLREIVVCVDKEHNIYMEESGKDFDRHAELSISECIRVSTVFSMLSFSQKLTLRLDDFIQMVNKTINMFS